MNVLITSAAAKIPLIEMFKAVENCTVIAADSDPTCLASNVADIFEPLPLDNDPMYREILLNICKQHSIQLIIPTRDAELPLLLSMKATLHDMGICLPLPDKEALDICLDKIAFYEFCLREGFPVLPRLYGVQPLSCFARHRFGAGGRDSFKLLPNTPLKDADDYLIQPICTDPEYSCDLLMDFTGKPVQAVVRERQKITGGESWQTQVVDIPTLTEMAINIGKKLGLKGHNLIQFFYCPDTGPYVIEVNARFGGASYLSIKAGLNSPGQLMRMVNGETANPKTIQIGLSSQKTDNGVIRYHAP